MDAWAALRLQVEWGADEALQEAPVNRLDREDAARALMPEEGGSPRPTARPAAPSVLAAAASAPAAVRRAQEIAAAAATLDELRDALGGFDGCPLAATATNLVFADGNPAAGLMLIGEGPGADEDRLGKPFVGLSGQLLDRMLASVGLDRTRLLITNLVPWRPPGNRNPTDSEIMTCLPFLHRHIALAAPRHLVLLGAMATRTLTGRSEGIRSVRGRWTEVSVPGLAAPIPALPMLHPAYLLRSPGAKRDAWADMIALRLRLDADV